MKPEILMIESDHDMRNPADFLVLDKLAKGIFRVPGISRVQAITRPDGTTMDHTSIPFQMSMQNAGQVQTLKYQRDRMNDMLKQADDMAKTIVDDAADVWLDDATLPIPPTAWSATPLRCRKSPTSCAITSRISKISSDRSAATSIGKGTVRHSGLLVASVDIRRDRRRRPIDR